MIKEFFNMRKRFPDIENVDRYGNTIICSGTDLYFAPEYSGINGVSIVERN